MANIDTINTVGSATKYKYTDNTIVYRMEGIKILVKGDIIKIRNQFLHPSDSQNTVDALFGQISEKFGANTAEEYVEYLIQNNILFSGQASEVISYPEATKMQVVGDISYFGWAEPGAIESDAVWKAMRLDETVVGDLELKKTWADGANYSQVATDLTSLTYS